MSRVDDVGVVDVGWGWAAVAAHVPKVGDARDEDEGWDREILWHVCGEVLGREVSTIVESIALWDVG